VARRLTFKIFLGLLALAALDVPPSAHGAAIGSWPGYARVYPARIEVVNNRAYVSFGNGGLGIFDVSDPAHPLRLGGYKTSGYAYGLKVVGNYAYVADYQGSGLLILDVSNPAIPTRVGSLQTVSPALRIAVSGDFAYLAGNGSEMEVINISNRAQPTRVASYSSGATIFSIDVSSNRAYLAVYPNQFQILDLTNPTNPVLAGTWSSAGIVDVQVVGNLAYLAAGSQSWQIVNVSNAAVPSLLGTVSALSSVSAIHVAGSRAYVIDGGDLRIFDVSNPAAAGLLTTYYTPAYSGFVTVSGTNAYVADGDYGVSVLNVSNPAAPLPMTNFAKPAFAYAAQIDGSRAYLADGRGGLRVIDVSQPDSPVGLGSLDLNQAAYDVAASGRYAYVAADFLSVVDVTNAASPIQVGGYSGSIRRVQVAGNLVWALDSYSGLQVLSMTNPASPVRLGSYNIPGSELALHVVGNRAYLSSDGLTNFHILDVSNPANPFRIGSYGSNYFVPDLRVAGNYACLAVQEWTGSNYFQGLEIVDVSQPAKPVRVSRLDLGVTPYRISIANNLAYLANGRNGVLVVDISDPAKPACVGGFDTEGTAFHVDVSGGLAYVADGESGLLIATIPTNGAPFIVSQPQSQTVLAGVSVAFDVAAQCGPFTYQWRFNGVELPGASSNRLVLPNVFTNQSGGYSVVVSNLHGAVTSAVATLSVQFRAPTVTPGSATTNLLVGQSGYVCATVRGAPAPVLQWYFNGAPVSSNGNYFCFSFSNAETNQSGDYTLVASNISGVVTGAAVHISVVELAPVISPNADIRQVLAGTDLSYCFGVNGGPVPSLQWRFGGTNLPGQVNRCLTLVGVETNQSGNYTLVASNRVGVSNATLFVSVIHQAPVFDIQPASQATIEGADVSLIARAAAGPPANYYLLFNGTNIPVPYTFSPLLFYPPPPPAVDFSLLQVATNDAGNYRIVASNLVGMATSQVATITVTPAGPLDRWTQRNPLPQSQPILSLAHSSNLFVSVGERGVIMTSTNGVDWATQRRRVDVALRGVTWGGGQFMAVGDGGVILGSPDGTNWTHRLANAPATQYNPNLGNLYDVTYGNGTFVAIGYNPPTAFTSSNGFSWQQRYVGGGYLLSGVAFGSNTFLAVGSGTFTSPDGLIWTQQAGPPDFLEHVSFVNNLFLVVGNNGRIGASPDGVLWTLPTTVTTRRLLDITYGNGTYAAVGVRGTVLTATNILNWTTRTSGTPDRLEAITFANGQFVAAGENGTTITSTNATAWTKRNFGTTLDLDGMVVAAGTIVIVGKVGAILRSTDGVNYNQEISGSTNDLHGVGWAKGLFVAVGEPGEILTSPDAVHWTHRDSGNTNSLKAVTYSPEIGLWITVGTQAAILTSPDAVVWTPRTISYPYYDLNAVAWGNGTVVVGGDGSGGQDGSIHRSSDGITWVSVSAFGKNVRGVTFWDGLFLATANDGQLLVSGDGFNWSQRFSGITLDGQNLRDAHFARGLWTVVGNGGIILTSTNTFNWTRRPSRVFENLHRAGYLNGKLVVMGNRGTILQSDRFVTELDAPTFVSGTGFRFPIEGVINRTYQIQASTNLANWINLLTFTNLVERSEFTDTNALQLPRRFYRLVEP
jgi:hypothetical protein